MELTKYTPFELSSLDIIFRGGLSMEITKYSPFELSLLVAIRSAGYDLFRFFQMGKSGDEHVYDLLHISEIQRKYTPLEEMTMQILNAVQVVDGIPGNPEVKVLDYFNEKWMNGLSVLETPEWYHCSMRDKNFLGEIKS